MEGLRLLAWVFRWTCPGKLRACRSFGFHWACPGLLRACNKKSILNIHCENGVNTDCLPTPDILPLLCSLLPVFCNYLSFYHLTIIVSTWQYCVALKLLLDVLSLNLPSCELKKNFVFIQIVTVPFPFSPAQSTSSDDGLFLKRAVWGPGLWRADRWTAEN